LSDKHPADDYATLNVETQGHQPQYDVIQLDPRHRRRESDTDVNEYVQPDIRTYSNLANWCQLNRQQMAEIDGVILLFAVYYKTITSYAFMVW